MNVFVREIPYMELLLICAMLGFGALGFFSLPRKNDPSEPMEHGTAGKWILASLVGVAALAIILLFVASIFMG